MVERKINKYTCTSCEHSTLAYQEVTDMLPLFCAYCGDISLEKEY